MSTATKERLEFESIVALAEHSLLPIEEIVVGDRCRKKLGDIPGLAKSISESGLLNLPVITPDRKLVAGLRRLKAFELLGFTEIPVTIAENLSDASAALKAERDENTCRLDMSLAEKLALGEALEAIERPKAKERQAHGLTAPGKTNAPGTIPEALETRDLVGQAIDMSGKSYSLYKRALNASKDETLPESVREAAGNAVETIKETGAINGPHFRAFEGAMREAGIGRLNPDGTFQRIKPKQDEKPKQSPDERLAEIKRLAGQGCLVEKISRKVGLAKSTVKKYASEAGIDLHGGANRLKINPDRVVGKTVSAANALSAGEDLLVAALPDVDQSKIDDWLETLREAQAFLRRLTRLLRGAKSE